jgi:microcystin-dependent protein
MVGDTKTSMVRVDHLGWLVCDGRALLKSEYRSLYAVLGDDFNPPMVDPSYFYLPDAQGRVVGLIGAAVDVSDRVWLDGEISGDYVHTLTIDEMPRHSHDPTGGDDGFNGGVANTGVNQNDSIADARESVGGGDADVVNAGEGTHTHPLAIIGGSQPHSNIQPTIFMGNLFVYCGQPGKNITQADGISLPAAGVRSYYPPSEPANKLY